MKTALETLKELRSKVIENTSYVTYDDYKKQYFNKLKNELEDYINQKLIDEIKLHPNHNYWIVSVPLKLKYRQIFPSDVDFLNFVKDSVVIPQGFKVSVPLEFRIESHYRQKYIRVVLEETLQT
ncbi:hypothetical protein FDH01_gp310 [Acinetobacter phage vB_AbaM_ME3]|uniref:Uncharacterized protein n=1 Tax=Acinetobacter phage vB_AbaM_ME3 TaxID=1837876 RepID=A0A172Q0D0_9CAUD|nr:hypothetical protein FDH01_gp310 [Acinetobacter phage vB_AbaM_ME3]AND75312.1 hypothetical protein ME3_151 [Acinetobacter phage vB_AbaM_ME3]